ncbi:MAG TPA: Na+/H+ antiporter NhaC family protein [Thermoplasmata archaeon]|nr:Na+/H+ antiporter NhaC family protein [Thermoplasmata archaeon]
MQFPGVPVSPPWLALLPPIMAILLCFLTKRVLFSLFIGILSGAMLLAKLNPFSAVANTAVLYVHSLAGVSVSAEGVMEIDLFHPTIILFDFVIGGLVGLIYLSGGAQGFANLITSKVKTRRGGQLASAAMGCAIFFDDYSNTIIVGNSMRPVADRLKISKEKFSYVLDSTAAPIATIAIISTWIGYEVGVIGDALKVLPEAFPSGAYMLFLDSIPYSFYSIFALLLVFLIASTSRDFGPMLDAEHRSITTGKLIREGATPLLKETNLEVMEDAPKKAINFLIPILFLIGISLFGMWWTGGGPGGESFINAIANSDSMLALLWGSIGATLVAMVMYGIQGIANLSRMMDAFINGAKMMILANLILVSAWSISAICGQVGTANYVIGISESVLRPWILPALIFVISGFIAFSTGTSWATMGIVIPIALPLAYSLGVPLHIVTAAVLTGSIFGDHCSPISDTTVLSSTFAGSDHLDHVKTQMPYALLVASVTFFMFLLVSLDFDSLPLLLIALFAGGLIIYSLLLFLSDKALKKRGVSPAELKK